MARILVAEPHPETRELLERLVARLGHEVVARKDADAAQILVFDPAARWAVGMARRLRREHGCALIACATRPGDLTDGEALATAADLCQPFEPDQLAWAIGQALDGPVH